MVASKHYQRLKHLYDAASAEDDTGRVEVTYGYAEIEGTLPPDSSDRVLSRMPHQRLLSDVSWLAAGSVEKEGLLTLDHFNHSVSAPDYRGPVLATAEVVVAEPPRYHVRAVMMDEEGEVLAEALALYEPSGEELPPDPAPETEDGASYTPPPAPFMPVHVTKHGVLCLN